MAGSNARAAGIADARASVGVSGFVRVVVVVIVLTSMGVLSGGIAAEAQAPKEVAHAASPCGRR